MVIQIEVKHAEAIADTQTEFLGAPIDDVDVGMLWVVVDPNDIQIDAKWWQVKEPFEAWGQLGTHSFTEYEIHSCTWEGFRVVNEDEVLEIKELNDG